jgi:hypothetical protein
MDWLLTYADPTLDWNYALSTLLVRFIGVFVVMFIMQVSMQGAAVAVRWWEERSAPPSPAPAPPAVTPAPGPRGDASGTPGQGAIDDAELAAVALALSASDEATVAAIAAALAIEARPAPTPLAATGTSSWAVAGRLQQLHRQPR